CPRKLAVPSSSDVRTVLIASSLFSVNSFAPLVLPSFPTRRSSDLPVKLQAATPSSRSAIATRVHETISPVDRSRIVSCPLVAMRSEEHTSELQSRGHLVCRLLLEKKKSTKNHLIATCHDREMTFHI